MYLDEQDLNSIADLIATRVARQLATLLAESSERSDDKRRRSHASPGYLDAREVASRFGVSRDWVYTHQTELGGFKLGCRHNSPLRFDLSQVEHAIDRLRPARPAPVAADEASVRPRGRPRRESSDVALIRGLGPLPRPRD
jgi:predicted DNA-binding transcriptional regulator AlpA